MIVTVLCDLGVKYLSKVYNQTWLEENNINGTNGTEENNVNGMNGTKQSVRRGSLFYHY